MIIKCLYILLYISMSGSIYDQSFMEGNDAYYKKDFSTAISKYEKLIESGVENPALFYNLGNAYYHMGKKGLAIANYERALDLNPSFKMAKDNLDKVLNETKRNLAIPDESLWWKYLFIWHYGLNLQWTWGICLVFWIIGWTLFAFLMWVKKEVKKYFLILSLICLLVSIVFFTSAIIKKMTPPLGVIVVSESSVRIAPSNNSPTRFNLYEGDRVRVRREDNGWALILTVDKEQGWIKNNEIFIWKPPYRKVELNSINNEKES